MIAAVNAPPATPRINYRIIAFAALVLLLLGLPLYSFLDETIHHGIHKDGRVDLKAMGNFWIDEQMNGTIKDVPPEYRALNGKHVILEGFMVPTVESGDRVSQFQLVYNVQKCCFGGPPKAQERVFAKVPNGRKVDFVYDDVARVSGILHVDIKIVAGKLDSVYTLDVDKVEDTGS